MNRNENLSKHALANHALLTEVNVLDAHLVLMEDGVDLDLQVVRAAKLIARAGQRLLNLTEGKSE